MSEKFAPVVNRQLQRPEIDRRRAHFPRLFIGAIVHGRRRGPRRRCDSETFYVDWYDERLFLAATGIFLFCCFDALFTLMLLRMGAEEVNPLMATLIDYGVEPFVYIKLLITGLGVVFLVMHSTFQIAGAIRVSQAIYAIMLGYAGLFLYQLALLSGLF
jgi:hypothetical protein